MMVAMSWFLRRPVVMALVGLVLAGCGGNAATSTADRAGPHADGAVIDERVASVHLNTDAGSVSVASRPGTAKVSVHRVIHNQSGKRVGTTTRIDRGVLTLDGCEPRCAVDYTLVVPPGVTVDGATTDGSVTLTSINGIDVATENGDLTVQHVTAAPVVLHSENGRIRGTDLAGSGIRAQSENGGIDLAVTTPQDVTAQLANGTIALTVPSQPYQVSITHQNGPVSLGVPDSPTARYHLNLRVDNGDISVRPAR